jgi:large subunit ribosomal protein L21
MQAIIKVGSTQFLVSPGQEILVDRPAVDSILAVFDGENIHIGQPVVADAHVNISILGEERGEKVRISKYKAKSRYRKVRGFKAEYSRIKIEDIFIGEKKKETKTVETSVKASEEVAKPKKARTTKAK